MLKHQTESLALDSINLEFCLAQWHLIWLLLTSKKQSDLSHPVDDDFFIPHSCILILLTEKVDANKTQRQSRIFQYIIVAYHHCF